jgi:hypothetical protein
MGTIFLYHFTSKSANAQYLNAFIRQKWRQQNCLKIRPHFGSFWWKNPASIVPRICPELTFLSGPFLVKRPNIRPVCSAARKEFPYQGVTNRCRLSWLTNRALVCEFKCGGRGVAGTQPKSTAVHKSPNKIKRSSLILNQGEDLSIMKSDKDVKKSFDSSRSRQETETL